ncbi:hypothetical protein UY3_07333 [Chelonia mydas]|uniref:Uncharacterized protein n=1 Tax=Chelonia mydas TaxID=8469 RepID=M7BBR2_CHEMY|nr:hypothetical protein UY3_07333 [Chelonia mydas]
MQPIPEKRTRCGKRTEGQRMLNTPRSTDGKNCRRATFYESKECDITKSCGIFGSRSDCCSFKPNELK